MTLAKLDSTKGENQSQPAGKVIYSVTGDAMLVVVEIGREKFLGTKGSQLLVDTISDRIFQAKQRQARKLLRQGQRPDGLLARAATESMTQWRDALSWKPLVRRER